MELLVRYMKKADKDKNRITLPKFIIDKYGKDFYLEVYSDGTMKLIPINFKKNK